MTAIRSKHALAAAILAVSFAGTLSPAAQAQTQEPREAVISVSGQGTAAIAPDMAILSFSVLKDAKTAREALDANNKAMADVLGALKKDGIADRDLQTSGFSINPQYQFPDNNDGGNRPPVLTGYQVANSLTIRVRDLARLGDIIDQAVTLGINQGGSIQFSNDKPDAVVTKARQEAVADALAKAKVLSEAAGVSLGRIVEISENSMAPEPMPMLRSMAKASADSVPIANGENGYSVNVNVTFSIKQ